MTTEQRRPPAGAGADAGIPAGPGGTDGSGSLRTRVRLAAQGMPQPGVRPQNGRQRVVKACWMFIWTLYLVPTVVRLFGDDYAPAQRAMGWAAFLLFFGCYLSMVLRGWHLAEHPAWRWIALGGMTGTTVAATLLIGGEWTPLFIYCSVCAGAVLPARWAGRAILGVLALLVACGVLAGGSAEDIGELSLPTLLSGFAMIGLQRMVATLEELREARQTIAHLAASDERLRLARDLHDLLGHSLSLITLKSELAGRLLPEKPEQAAQQVGDIERVSRQALVDVREAVSGFRRATVGVELAGARSALKAAGVAAAVDPSVVRLAEYGHPRLAPEREGALAWALREAVTNVVRHSGASRCRVQVDEEAGEGGPDRLVLVVTDNGSGPHAEGACGNGLAGLEERLLVVDGTLTTTGESPGPFHRGGGFRLRAAVPLVPDPGGQGADGGSDAGPRPERPGTDVPADDAAAGPGTEPRSGTGAAGHGRPGR